MTSVGGFQEHFSRRKRAYDKEGVITDKHPREFHLIKENDGNRINHILFPHGICYICPTVGPSMFAHVVQLWRGLQTASETDCHSAQLATGSMCSGPHQLASLDPQRMDMSKQRW